MNESLLVGLVAMLGALAYNVYYFLKAVRAAQETKEVEKLNLVKTTLTVAPSLVAGALAGMAINPVGWMLVPVVMAGWAAADLGAEIGLNSYFDKPE